MRSPFLRLFVFGAGASVMAVEFGAQRLVAPFFGTSQPVWAVLIGLILAALSAGYTLGGRLADSRPTPGPLGAIVLAAGLYITLVPAIAEPILARMVAGLLDTPGQVVLLTFLAVALLFVPPVVALGAVSPYAVRLALREVDTAGRRTGSLYAWSTAGSIAGTFLSVFLVIPLWGVRAMLWLSAAVLILLGVVLLRRISLAPLLLAPLLASTFSGPLLKSVPGLVTEIDTPYQFAQVYRLSDGDLALSVNDAAGVQSVATRRPYTGMEFDAFLPLPFLLPGRGPLSALLIGMAAGTIPTMYAREVTPYRRVRMLGVEIDPALTGLGTRYFGLRQSAARVVHADGRVYLETTGRRYDMVMVDAYSNEIYIPFTLSTREFFALCRAHLRPGGLLALNVGASSTHAPLLSAFERTLLAVFPHVALTKTPGLYNYLLVASERPLHPFRIERLPLVLRPLGLRLDRGWRPASPGPGIILSDDRAPVELLTDQMIVERLRAALTK